MLGLHWRRRVGRLLRRGAAAGAPSPDARSFYRLSPTCQIPRLGDLYAAYFGERSHGFFVEIGAFDGEYASNTSGLADLGWSGVYAEPVERNYEACRERHKDNGAVSVRRVAIGDRPGKAQIDVAGPLSTMDAETRATFEGLDWARDWFAGAQRESVEQMTLDAFLALMRVEPGFDLLVIDVEGAEWSVLQPFDLRKWRPAMVIIELHDQNPDYAHLRSRANAIVSYFAESHYKVIYKDFTNTVYVPEERTLA